MTVGTADMVATVMAEAVLEELIEPVVGNVIALDEESKAEKGVSEEMTIVTTVLTPEIGIVGGEEVLESDVVE